jgi:hypothetical protein
MKSNLPSFTLATQEYLRVNAMFLPTSVNPTVHAQQVFAQYSKDLALVTMEGREAKHIFLKKLNQNTTYQRWWLEIFKHEYIMLVWLPEHGYELSDAPY